MNVENGEHIVDVPKSDVTAVQLPDSFGYLEDFVQELDFPDFFAMDEASPSDELDISPEDNSGLAVERLSPEQIKKIKKKKALFTRGPAPKVQKEKLIPAPRSELPARVFDWVRENNTIFISETSDGGEEDSGQQETFWSPLSEEEVDESISLRKKLVKQPLLSHPEEIELAKRVEKGKRAEVFLSEENHISQREKNSYNEQIREAKEARRIFIEANLRLVPFALKSFLKKGFDDDDLIQVGRMGLMHAVDKWDYTRGFRFSTFGHQMIRWAVMGDISNNLRAIRYPDGLMRQLYQHALQLEQLHFELGREPTREEIATKMGVSGNTIERYEQLKNNNISSLDQQLGDSESTLYDQISEGNSNSIEKEVDDRDLQRSLQRFIETKLDAKKRRIVELLLYDGTDKDLSNAEIGERTGVSRERIRQQLEKVQIMLAEDLEENGYEELLS